VLFIVLPSFSREWKVYLWTFCGHMDDLLFLNLDMVYPFLHSVLGEAGWKFIKIKDNSAFHSNEKLLVNFLWSHRWSVVPQFGCGVSMSAICFRWAWVEVHQNKRKKCFSYCFLDYPQNEKLPVHYCWHYGCHDNTETDCCPSIGICVSISAICFKWGWMDVHQIVTVLFIVFPSFSIEWKVTCKLFWATWEIL